MKRSEPSKRKAAAPRTLKFDSRLKNIARGMEYYALVVPPEITQALGTHGPVPVSAQVNGSETFQCSLYPMGEGCHQMRVRNAICKSVNIAEGDRVRVEITVRDRSEEMALPADLKGALRAAGAEAGFKALPLGKRSFALRTIESAVKPETRAKRIQELVQESRARGGRLTPPRAPGRAAPKEIRRP